MKTAPLLSLVLFAFLSPWAIAQPSRVAGTIDTIAGSGDKSDNGPTGPALSANMDQPFGLEIGPDGALYICERGLHRIRRWDPKTKVLSTVAGTGKPGFAGDGGPATEAKIKEPHELRFDKAGNLYWTDMSNHVIRRVDRKTGVISTYAGTGAKPGFSGDGGPAAKAQLAQPHSLAFDADDNLYIADIGNHRIRKVDAKTGVIETIGGTGEKKLPKDGAVAKTSPILGPRALFVAGDVLWVALREGHAVWKLDLKSGTLHHVGGDGVNGFAVADGPVKNARFSGPKGIAVGPDGMVYVVDSGNHLLRRIDPGKATITTVAGIPKEAKFTGDGGPAAKAHLNNLHGVCITPEGTIYIGDSDNHRVRRVSPAGVKDAKQRPKSPNILWITSEDHGPHLGCYGDRFARTPNLDRLAKKGMIFNLAWSNAPVCAPARTTIISGLYPPSTGAEHMRSMTRLPSNMFMFPYYLRRLGYYCTNKVKEDYNLEKTGQVWDDSSNKAHPKNRAAGQPYFAVFNSTKSHESQIRGKKTKLVGDPSKVRVPAYHPDTPEVRDEWTRYYDLLEIVDADVAELLRELESQGLLEDTIIFYFADHGSGMPRNKRTPLNSGLQVPMIVHFPDAWKHLAPPDYAPGARSDRLVSFVDLAPTMLSLAGEKAPEWMQGRAFAGSHIAPANEFLHGFRGRMDERYDLQRSVTDGRYVYLRNYMPHLPAGQHVEYMFVTKTTQVWKKQFDLGKLNDAQSRFWTTPRDAEELYDLQSDPDEVVNLAGSKEHQATLERLRNAQREHALRIRDVGLLPEDEMHRRSAGKTPYEFGHDRQAYPLERILETAELASRREPAKLPARLTDPDSGVRCWSAMGLLALGKDAVRTNRETLLKSMKDDDCPSVRVVAAEAIATFGEGGDRADAVARLLAQADAKKNSMFVSMAALNALDRLVLRDAEIAAAAKLLPTEPSDAKHRAAMGVSRLLTSIQRNATGNK